jgi:CubicO group peptidase (beta-lactamase class C family)
MEADANWVLDKAGIERGGCCISATLRDYARFGLFIAKGDAGPAGAVLPAGWIEEARTPVWPATDDGSGYGWFWWVRQDGGYEAVGAYGQSVTIYPKDDVVIAVNAASRDPPGFGIARWRLLQALDAAAVGRSDPNDKTEVAPPSYSKGTDGRGQRTVAANWAHACRTNVPEQRNSDRHDCHRYEARFRVGGDTSDQKRSTD